MFRRFVLNALREIEEASREETEAIFDDYTVSNFTVTRELNASTATLSDAVNFLCTISSDLQTRGQRST